MLTKIKLILLKEEITAAKLYEEISKIFYPSVQVYKLSNIISGKHQTAYIVTYIKILRALNSLTGKCYKLEDIVQDDLTDNDLK